MLAFVNIMDAAVVAQFCCVMEQQHQQQHLQADAFVLRVALVLLAIQEVRYLHNIHPIDNRVRGLHNIHQVR